MNEYEFNETLFDDEEMSEMSSQKVGAKDTNINVLTGCKHLPEKPPLYVEVEPKAKTPVAFFITQ